MKVLPVVLIIAMCVSFMPAQVWADDIAEIKQMMMDMKKDYEAKIQILMDRNKDSDSKIQMLEDKIHISEVKQSVSGAKIEQRSVQTVERGSEKSALDIEYVGRHNAPVGDGGVVVNNPFGFGNVSFGGYFDHEYHDFDNTESTFRQHRWIINIGAQLTDRISFSSEYEIEYGGPNSAGGDGEARVEQAYINFMINDMINFRGGAILTPFGRYNLYHDSDLQDLTARPLVARDIIPTTWTESGAGFFGEFNPTIGDYEDLLINYELYLVNGLDNGFSDTGLGGARSSLKTDNNDDKAVVGRVVFSPWLGHEFGLSGYHGEIANEDDAIGGGAVDYFGSFGPLEIVVEYAHFAVKESSPISSKDLPNFLQGAYVQANYHFWPEFLDDSWLGRRFDNPTFTLVGRYDWAEIDDDGNDSDFSNNEEERWTMGFNYRPVDSTVFKFEYQFNDTKNEALERGNNNGFLASVAVGF